MQLKFKNQRCQEDAALAVVSVLQGQPKNDASSAPGSRPEFRNGKLYYYNANRTVAVIADVGGGYLRIKDMTRAGRRSYLDINGNDANNYTDARGKRHGRNQSQRWRSTATSRTPRAASPSATAPCASEGMRAS